MTEICSFFQMKSLKLDMHFTLTVHLNEDLPHSEVQQLPRVMATILNSTSRQSLGPPILKSSNSNNQN